MDKFNNQILRVVALTVTALDSGEPLARAGVQISSSFSQPAAGLTQRKTLVKKLRLFSGKGHTRCLANVMWCLTPCATLEVSVYLDLQKEIKLHLKKSHQMIFLQ